MPPKKKSKSKTQEPEPQYEEDLEPVMALAAMDDDPEDDGITRCVCGSQEEELGMMIQCETCKVWQHGICVGFHSVEDVPEMYYCEQCRPELHLDLLSNPELRPVSDALNPPYLRCHRTTHRKSAGHQRTASTNVMPPPSHEMPLQHESTNVNNLHPPNTTSSTSNSQSGSPPPGPMIKSTKRRNTLRSREAAFEDALAHGDVEAMEKITAAEEDGPLSASGKRKRKRSAGLVDDSSNPKRKRSSPLLDSATSERLELPDDGFGREPTDGGGSVNGSLKAESMSKGRSKRSKRDKDGSMDPEDPAALTPSSQPSALPAKKHANQYTYRGKPTTSPNKGGGSRGSASVAPEQSVPMGPSNSKKGGNSNAISQKNYQASAFAPASPHQPVTVPWGLPDHLSHLSDLLPSAMQGPIDVPIGNGEIIQERGAKVKWPIRRTLITEMRRRVRAMLDYCTKAQADVAERAKRTAALDAFARLAEEAGLEGAGFNAGNRGKAKSDSGVDCDLVATIVVSPEVMNPQIPVQEPRSTDVTVALADMTTSELLASLTQDLLSFQERFGAGPGGKVYKEVAPREKRPRGAAAAAMAAMERSD